MPRTEIKVVAPSRVWPGDWEQLRKVLRGASF